MKPTTQKIKAILASSNGPSALKAAGWTPSDLMAAGWTGQEVTDEKQQTKEQT